MKRIIKTNIFIVVIAIMLSVGTYFAGAEEVIYSATEMIRMENANRKRLGVYAEMPVYSIPYPQIKKIAALKNHIWGL